MRPLDISQRQVRAIIRAAAKEGHRAELVLGKTVVRLIPDTRDVRPQSEGVIDEAPDPETFESLDDYLAWRDRSRARENQGRS